MILCRTCRPFLNQGPYAKAETSSKGECCSMCLGVHGDCFQTSLRLAVEQAMEPYVHKDNSCGNRFSYQASPPTIVLPGDLLYRYELLAKQSDESSSVITFCQSIKTHAKDQLLACLCSIEQDLDKLSPSLPEYPTCVQDEEQGRLGVHVFCLPRRSVIRPAHLFSTPTKKRRNRKRMLDEDSQGGDPRTNLENKINRQADTFVWSLNRASPDSNFSPDAAIDQEIQQEELTSPALDFYVAVWRRPFYLRGMYTKSRRDVSQTPFYVVDDGKRRKLGATSVQEQITPIVTRHCGGVSARNNDPTLENVVYGMCKFHASGREDMDVPMLLPNDDDGEQQITGRPFVCEMTDSFQMPSPDLLSVMVNEINHTQSGRPWSDPRSYGNNPMGVGIAREFGFVSSSTFKNLQAETESKTKYYGCLCWSKAKLPRNDEKLMKRLGNFPLQIFQRTPIRVLHRRANVVRIRHVLSCKARIVDEHHFRLHISTDAGAYVKEFVHSDLGRTEPSVASLLGCQTDILELDCEGIQGAT